MSIFPSRRLQNLWNHIYPVRYRILWFVPFPTSEQFIVPKDAWKKSWRQKLPFSTSGKTTQPTTQSNGIANKNISIENLSGNHDKNVSAFKENVPASFFQPTRLRIFREYDRSVAPQCAGRMVISGRMTDVCAEIDRLARTRG